MVSDDEKKTRRRADLPLSDDEENYKAIESSASGHHLSAIGQDGVNANEPTTIPQVAQPQTFPQQNQKQRTTDKASIDGSYASRRLRDDGRSYRSEDRSDDFSIHSYRRYNKREKMPVSVGIITVCLFRKILTQIIGYFIYWWRSCIVFGLGRLESIRRSVLFVYHTINNRLR